QPKTPYAPSPRSSHRHSNRRRRRAQSQSETIRRQIDGADQLLVPGNGVAVGHSGDEIPDRAQLLDTVSAALPRLRQSRWVSTVGGGETGNRPLRFIAHRGELRGAIELVIEKALERSLFDRECVREADEC